MSAQGLRSPLICAEGNSPLIQVVHASLDALERSPEQLDAILRNTRLIKDSDRKTTYSVLESRTSLIAKKTLERGALWVAGAMRHEAKHQEIYWNNKLMLPEETVEEICIRIQADCLEELGFEYYGCIPFNKEAFVKERLKASRSYVLNDS